MSKWIGFIGGYNMWKGGPNIKLSNGDSACNWVETQMGWNSGRKENADGHALCHCQCPHPQGTKGSMKSFMSLQSPDLKIKMWNKSTVEMVNCCSVFGSSRKKKGLSSTEYSKKNPLPGWCEWAHEGACKISWARFSPPPVCCCLYSQVSALVPTLYNVPLTWESLETFSHESS